MCKGCFAIVLIGVWVLACFDRVAYFGQSYEVHYEAKKTGRSKAAVKKAVKRSEIAASGSNVE